MLADLRFAIRQFLKSPGFTLMAAMTLAVGIGANTAIFSLINAILLEPLPYPDSQRLVQVNMRPNIQGGGNSPTSGGIYLDFVDASDQFESLAATHSVSYNLSGLERPVRLNGLEATASYLPTLGVTPALGRNYTEENELPGGDSRVILLADNVWRNHFGSDPSIVGRPIRLNDEAYTVVGILPPGAFIASGIDFLAPAAIRAEDHKQLRRYTYVTTITGRLKEGATVESARSELETIKAGLNDRYPDMMKAWGINVRTLQEAFFGNSRPYVMMLLIAVGLVLLVGCANVANLLLARAAARQGEIAVRSALGASGWKIARQLLCESLILASLGGAIGLVVGIAALKPLSLLLDLDSLPGLELGIDLRVLLFTASISAFTGVFFGIFPAIKSLRSGAAAGMRDSTRSSTSARGQVVQSSLIVAEIAITVILLVCIGLMVKSFSEALANDPGFRRESALTFELARSETKAPTPEDRVRFTDELLDRIGRIPGVQNVAMISTTPMNNNQYYGAPFWRDDQPDTANTYFTGFDCINGDVFKTLGIPLLRGRSIESFDHAPDAPKVIVISEQVVEDVFPNEDPIGHIVHHDGETWQVVGVVGDVSRFALDGQSQPMVYKPQGKWPWASSYIVRATVPPLQLVDQVRGAVLDIDPDQPIDRVRTLEDAVSASLEGRVAMTTLIGIFGITATFLAAIGLYGLTSYTVEQRQREFGIRLAIGAQPGEIVGMVLKQGLVLAIIGISIGAALALALGRFLAFILYEVEPYDPLVLAGVLLVTIGVTALACWKPARIASRVNPSDALRAE